MDILNGKKGGFLVKNFLSNKIWIRILEIFLGILFIYSGALKIKNILEFSLTVAKYGIIPEKLINLFSIILPFFEIFSGFFLLTGILIKGASFIISFMLFIFIIALSYTIFKGVHFECGCFRIFGKEPETGILLILRNLFLILLSINIFIFSKKT